MKLPMLCVCVAAICLKFDLSQMYVCVYNYFMAERDAGSKISARICFLLYFVI